MHMHLAAVLCLLLAATAARADRPEGTRLQLPVGEMFVPDGYVPDEGAVHLVLHLHGSAQVAESNLMRSGERAVLVTVVLPGLSGVYTKLFGDPSAFDGILSSAMDGLAQLPGFSTSEIAHLTVTSFSAGFGGVREMLKSETTYKRIDALVMADSIYAGYVGDPARRKVDPALMEGFLRFARDAAASRKTMVISHSDLIPGTYASTRETADYLIERIGGKREEAAEDWAEDFRCTSAFRRGAFRVFGFAGETGPDHMKHLHNLWMLMQRALPKHPEQ